MLLGLLALAGCCTPQSNIRLLTPPEGDEAETTELGGQNFKHYGHFARRDFTPLFTRAG